MTLLGSGMMSARNARWVYSVRITCFAERHVDRSAREFHRLEHHRHAAVGGDDGEVHQDTDTGDPETDHLAVEPDEDQQRDVRREDQADGEFVHLEG